MEASLLTALIAATVSLIGSMVSFTANRRAVRTEILKLEIELTRRLTEKLYDKRLDVYPAAFEITDDLRGKYLFRSNISKSKVKLKEVKDRLVEWHKKNGLILSEETIEAYKYLRWNLENVIDSKDDITEEKLRPIWDGKISFRRAMRKDLNLLYAEEISKGKVSSKVS